MKKVIVNLKVDQIGALDQYFDIALDVDASVSNQEKCVYTLLRKWQLKKLKPKLFITQPGKMYEFKLGAPLAFAFLAFFEWNGVDPTSPLGSNILAICGKIDQQFK